MKEKESGNVKPDEFRAMLTKIVENRDNQALVTELATKLGDTYTSTHTNFETLNGESTKKDQQIKDLQATNMNLFLRVGQQTPEGAQVDLGKTEPMTYEKLLEGMI